MARPRKNVPIFLFDEVAIFATRLSMLVEKFVAERIQADVARAISQKKTNRPPREKVLCYVPGCQNIAAPRFQMMCAAEHKKLSKVEKAKYREKRERKQVAERKAKK